MVSKVTRHDLLRVLGQGREEGLDPKTINRKLIVALMALRNAGADIEMQKGDWPKITEPIVEIYDARELTSFFRASGPQERLLFETFLCTGFRKQEIATLTWNDVDFEQRTVRVRSKPEYRFEPKNHEEREPRFIGGGAGHKERPAVRILPHGEIRREWRVRVEQALPDALLRTATAGWPGLSS